jgi:hypothetical protein
LTRSFSSSSNTQLLRVTSSSAEVRISRLHFKDGLSNDEGAAIYNAGKLTLKSCVLSGNKTTNTAGKGGAIYTTGSSASATISGCTFYGNAAGTTNGKGGAVYRNGGALTLRGNIFWGNTANTSPVVYHANPGATTGGYNVSDKASGYADNAASSGWTFAGGDAQAFALPLVPSSFRPFEGRAADGIIASTATLTDYPTVDFYGAAIPATGASAGAAQTTATGYLLDYAAEGPGTVTRTGGTSPDADGLFSGGSVTLTAAEDPGKGFLYWSVNGATLPAQTPNPKELTLTMDGHKTVRGVFGVSWTVTDAATLSSALTSAAAGDHISFPQGGTITLTTALPAITKSLIIEGNGATLTRSFSSGNNTQLLRITGSTTTVHISRLHFTGGRSNNYGAAISNAGNLTLESCIFSDNQTSASWAYGGAIFTERSLTVLGCTFTGNAAATTTDGQGGAICQDNGTLSLTGNIFVGNTGEYPVVFGYPGFTTSYTYGYNVSDKASGTSSGQSGWTFSASPADVILTDITFDADFKPSSATSLSLLPSLPTGFPTTYFDGSSRGTSSTPGAMPPAP